MAHLSVQHLSQISGPLHTSWVTHSSAGPAWSLLANTHTHTPHGVCSLIAHPLMWQRFVSHRHLHFALSGLCLSTLLIVPPSLFLIILIQKHSLRQPRSNQRSHISLFPDQVCLPYSLSACGLGKCLLPETLQGANILLCTLTLFKELTFIYSPIYSRHPLWILTRWVLRLYDNKSWKVYLAQFTCIVLFTDVKVNIELLNKRHNEDFSGVH